jgi:hypothetical protein
VNEHTPGPWVATGRSVNAPGSDRNICLVQSAKDAYDNARLIAAAPQLLETLDAVIREDCDGGDCSFEWHEKARAAIKKARGEA